MATLQARDSFGNVIHVQRRDSVAAVAAFAEGFLAYEPRILAVLAAAEHDTSLIVQACAAALWMFSESPAGPPQARAHLARARASVDAGAPSSERERQFASAVQAWVQGDLAGALALHAQLAREHPRDLAAIKLGQYHAFNLGDAPTMLRLALPAQAAAPEVAHAHGLLAFAHEQCHHLPQAEACARRALALRAAEPWAEHAIAHVMLTDGRFAEGRDFLARASAPWQGLTSFMRTHNWWHLALFHLELGDDAAALALYDQQVWGVDKTYSQDQVGAVSLLARLELAGVAVGERWQDLAEHLRQRVHDQVLPFLDLQYLYGLARAGRPEAETLRDAIVAHAPQAPAAARRAWQQVAVPAAHGLLAHARGHWAEAAEALAAALPQLLRIGGSHAQRELFEQLWLDAAQRAGDAATVLNVLQPRLNAAPQSRRLARRLRTAHSALGLPAAA
ncbi:tetratricopeptide repeat protein [Aquabacterium sp. OR-4]|uniref:tetratricopeptide repeat protein n=1 Tax=Aquabacterium sp. OR-4 TaxID=2978127 RepID=UPI0021B3EB43|nr:tetratricopeptide repeat protein [Aquabacterium sp. OR-4]MDT7834001.1 tetratricopeptide repeat protein [Aquabacterium sp. OR-4]